MTAVLDDLTLDSLQGHPRILMEADLTPVLTDRFQPTGFADLGAAVYELPDGTRKLLVESAQSMANRLENVCLDGFGPYLAKELDGLPYVIAELSGATVTETSSLVEAHRLNSPFIITDKGFQQKFVELSGYEKGKPISWSQVASAIFYFDPNCLVHGIFLANLGDGRVKIPRALTGFIEATNVREAVSGGVKNNALDPTGSIRAKGYDKDVYGNVPYHRTEYTAERIQAFFNLDVALLAGYGLPAEATELLIALSLYKVRRFLETGLRLRTACDFSVKGDITMVAPKNLALPAADILLSRVVESIKACTRKDLFASPSVTRIATEVVEKEKKKT
jgi:CRISPR-associated protein Csb1